MTIESIDPCAISVGPGGEKGTVGSGVACGAAGCDSSEFKKVRVKVTRVKVNLILHKLPRDFSCKSIKVVK